MRSVQMLRKEMELSVFLVPKDRFGRGGAQAGNVKLE